MSDRNFHPDAKKFAKLFETSQGQILVKLDSHDDTGEPEVRFYFDPMHESLGVCSFSLGFPATDKGEEAAEAVFQDIQQSGAEKAVSEKRAEIHDMMNRAGAA